MKNPGDVWKIATQPHKDAHFAIFPDKLVIPMIKAGCPTKVCPECGFIREQITDKEVTFTSGSGKSGNQPRGKYEGATQTTSGTYDIRMGPQVTHRTTGYTSCDCDAGWNPGVVLDPFAGSGTTMKVAKTLGR
jgi:hypothetical protein